MPNPSLWKITDSFDPSQDEMIDLAIERAWSAIRYEHGEDDEKKRLLLSLCVLIETQRGKENHLEIANRAIIQFRRQWANERTEPRARKVG